MSELALASWPTVDHEAFGPVRRVKRSRVQKLGASLLHRNWVRIPHVTNHDDADITELEALRKKINLEGRAKLTLLPFLVKAVADVLAEMPQFNASLEDDYFVMKDYCHVGFAVDSPHGLVVPVVRDVDSKDITVLGGNISELTAKGREGKLKPDEMAGGCFTISSLGGIGGRYFTPIINAPQIAILGVSQAALIPTWTGEKVEPRLMLPLSLSWDHRAVDGAAAARFLVNLRKRLASGARSALA